MCVGGSHLSSCMGDVGGEVRCVSWGGGHI